MIFSELYSAYYNAVAAILKEACTRPLSRGEMRKIIGQKAFGESLLSIEPALLEEKWPLLHRDGTASLESAPEMPLTLLQKRWLKALSLDPRIRLFGEPLPHFPDVEPLFRPEDIDYFDRYTDGDPYGDENYIRHFRTVLEAVRNRTPLSVEALSRKGEVLRHDLIPEYLEYSEKDDKFRLVGSGPRRLTVNLFRILRCVPGGDAAPDRNTPPETPEKRSVELELTDRRNALERVLMHFAHFEKQAEKLGPDRYRISIVYDRDDETEMVIRILAFGPMVKVLSPDSFTELIRERLLRQKALGPARP